VNALHPRPAASAYDVGKSVREEAPESVMPMSSCPKQGPHDA